MNLKRSKQLLKAVGNATRVLTDEEIKYLTPYLKIHRLSLHSNDVYKMERAIVTAKGYTAQNNHVLVMYANDIQMIFPYGIDVAVQGSENIEYVVLSHKGKPYIAAAVGVNELDINAVGREQWGEYNPRERVETVRAKRPESKTEYRLRLSKIIQGWPVFWLACAGLFFFFAMMPKSVELFIVLTSLGGICAFCALVANAQKTQCATRCASCRRSVWQYCVSSFDEHRTGKHTADIRFELPIGRCGFMFRERGGKR